MVSRPFKLYAAGRSVIAGLLAALPAGCSPPPASHAAPALGAGAPAWQAPRMEIASNGGTYYVAFSPRPADMPLNEMFSLRVEVLDAARRPLPAGEVELRVDAAMPGHGHGMVTRPQVTANADGTFTADGMLLHMPGSWELYFDVQRDGIAERAQVAVELE